MIMTIIRRKRKRISIVLIILVENNYPHHHYNYYSNQVFSTTCIIIITNVWNDYDNTACCNAYIPSHPFLSLLMPPYHFLSLPIPPYPFLSLQCYPIHAIVTTLLYLQILLSFCQIFICLTDCRLLRYSLKFYQGDLLDFIFSREDLARL